jgi:hypothetical protein
MPKHQKITATLTALCFFLFLSSSAQYDIRGLKDLTNYWEFHITAGANNFLGDIGGNVGKGKPFLKDYTFSTIRPLFGLSVSYNLNQFFALQAGVNYTWVTAADSLINNQGDLERWRYYRNLSFKSTILEGYFGGTVYPTMFFDRRKIELHKIVPFVTAGIGFIHFNPQAELNGEWIDLQPLHLEGQGFTEYPERKPYSLTSVYIPASVGVKYYINNVCALSTGFLFRKTFTDYIDDISTTYIDPRLFYNYLPVDKADIATQLYSRSRTPWKVKPDLIKAFSSDNDTYVSLFFTFSIRFGKYIPFYYPKL